FAGFSATQQAAVTQAHEIRQEAHTKAQAVLTSAGITREQMQKAMSTYRSSQRTAVQAALTANDYAAFKALVANSPMADKLTEAVFAKLVQIHKLEVSGDRAGAQALRKELRDSGVIGVGMGMGHKGEGMGGHGRGLDVDDK
ncbi:MAG: hypothetical protein WC030_03420, partial [Candidatus Paceibacterota bacterium]